MSASVIALNGLVAVPAVAAVVVLALGRRAAESALVLGAVAASLVTLAWSVWAVLAPGDGVDAIWIGALDVHWRLGLDGISSPLVLMTTLITACCLVSLVRNAPPCGGTATLAALLLLVEAGVLGSFLALDLVLFFVFFEVALIPMWFVINAWGDEHDPAGRAKAATRFLVFTVLGSAVMLVGFLIVHSLTGTFDITEIAASGYATRILDGSVTPVVASVLIAVGLAVKTPLVPLHIWLPDAHSKAPTVGSVLLAAVLLKLGTYGFIRFWMPVTDPSWELLAPVVAAVAVVGIVYASLACLAQTDLKRLIAYSSVGHMGFVVLAVATFSHGGVQAAVYASVAHGLITGLLFFVAGAIKDRYGTTDLRRLRLLYGRVPRLAGVFAFAAMASLGLPGLAGFWGEMLAIRSALDESPALPGTTYTVLAVIAALGVVLTSAYFLKLMRGMLQGAPSLPARDGSGGSGDRAGDGAGAGTERDGVVVESPETAAPVSVVETASSGRDVEPLEWVTWTPLVLATLVFGVAPGLLLGPVGEAARAFLGGLS